MMPCPAAGAAQGAKASCFNVSSVDALVGADREFALDH
jgi:hypothetical protein